MTFILGTSNQHKINELKAMLPKNQEIYSYTELIEPLNIIENGKSFKENAAIKVSQIYQALYEKCLEQKEYPKTSIALISEDSGLCVPALNGEPGIYSARYAQHKDFTNIKSNSSDEENLECLIQRIKTFAPTPAFFIAHIALIYIETTPLKPLEQCTIEHFEGILHGSVISEIRGKGGFGYDPIFIPNEDNPLNKTLAEFTPSAKNTISHRYKALLSCIKRFSSRYKLNYHDRPKTILSV